MLPLLHVGICTSGETKKFAPPLQRLRNMVMPPPSDRTSLRSKFNQTEC